MDQIWFLTAEQRQSFARTAQDPLGDAQRESESREGQESITNGELVRPIDGLDARQTNPEKEERNVDTEEETTAKNVKIVILSVTVT